MSNRRTILILFVGVLIGAVLTAIISLILGPGYRERDEDSPDGQTIHISSPIPDSPFDAESNPGEPTARQMNGDCSISGRVFAADKKPATDAQLRVRVLEDAWAEAQPEIVVETDREGSFSITGLDHRLSYLIYAWKDGSAVSALDRPECGSVVDLNLSPGGSLRLDLRKPITELGCEALEVRVAGADLWPARLWSGTPEGTSLVIAGLQPSEYSVAVECGYGRFVTEDPISIEGGRETALDIVLESGADARVTVLDASTRRPVSGATVLAHSPDAPLLETALPTDTDGVVSVPLLSARGAFVSAFGPGYMDSPRVQIDGGDERTIELRRGGQVSGTVLDGDGRPVEGARILVEPASGPGLEGIPGGPGRRFRSRFVEALRRGLPRMPQVHRDRILPGPPRIPLHRGDSPAAASISKGTVVPWEQTTADGEFALDGLPSGVLVLRAEHDEHIPAGSTELTLSEQSVLEGIELRVRRASTIQLRTVDDRGFPVRGATVRVYNRLDEVLAELTSETDGSALMTGLPIHVQVEVTADGYVPTHRRVRLRPGSEIEMELEIPPADKRIEGRVVDRRGYGVPATVVARAASPKYGHTITIETDTDGAFFVDDVGSLRYHLLADAGPQGRAQVPDASHAESVTLVVDPAAPPFSAERFARRPAAEYIPDQGGPAQVEPRGLRIVPPSGESPWDSYEPSAADRIPVTNQPTSMIVPTPDGGPAITITTRFGEADELPVTGPPPGPGGLPIQVKKIGAQVVVSHVAPGSRVAAAGLKPGARLLSIDRKKVSSASEARAAIKGPIGSVIVIEVQDGAEAFNIVVQRVRVGL